MQHLSPADDALASRILSEVGFDKRLVGHRFRQRAGALPASLYSVEDVVHLLNDKFPRLSLERLENWIRTVIRDEELADRIAHIGCEEKNDRDRLLRARLLLGERLCQCKQAAANS